MRRCLLLMLLVLLPLQFSWAAVVSYCGHESAPQAEHLGHHAHQHSASVAEQPQPEGKSSKVALDLDCGHCHVHGAVLPLSLDEPPAIIALDGASPSRVTGLARWVHAQPDRPQWQPLA